MPYSLEGNISASIVSPIYNEKCINGGHIILEEVFVKEPESKLPIAKPQGLPVNHCKFDNSLCII